MSNKTEFAGLNKIGTYLDEDLPKINENTEITDAQLKQAAQERGDLRESVERLAAVKPPEVPPATDKAPGIVRLATPKEAATEWSNTIAVTPAGLKAFREALPFASEVLRGFARYATVPESINTSLEDAAITPRGLAAVLNSKLQDATNTVPGIVRLATSKESADKYNDTEALTPKGLFDSWTLNHHGNWLKGSGDIMIQWGSTFSRPPYPRIQTINFSVTFSYVFYVGLTCGGLRDTDGLSTEGLCTLSGQNQTGFLFTAHQTLPPPQNYIICNWFAIGIT